MNEWTKLQDQWWNWINRLTNGVIESIDTQICEKQNSPKLILRFDTIDFSQILCVH